MTTTLEVYAEITCPFAHVGLKRVVQHVEEMEHPIDVIVRAWPLEWINGSGLDAEAVLVKATALHDQLGVDDFSGFRVERWPATTIPALELAAAAYEHDAATGLAVSLALRSALFEDGRDLADAAVLADIAARHDVTPPAAGSEARVRTDYAAGQARGVNGSPHFFVGTNDFFCPALDLGHDADNHLTARFDADGLAGFFATIDA